MKSFIRTPGAALSGAVIAAGLCLSFIPFAAHAAADNKKPPRAAPTQAPRERPEIKPVQREPVYRGPVRRGFRPVGPESHSFRVLTFNTALFSPIFQCGVIKPQDINPGPVPITPTCQLLNDLGEDIAERANYIADLLSQGEFDIVSLNEVWDEDDGKDVLEDRLKGTYPYYVKYVDVFGGGVEEDSGLMIFSKLPFQSLPDEYFKTEDSKSSYGDDSNRIAYIKYDDCEGFDCYAAKGAVMIRVKQPSSGRILNFIASHTQSDSDKSGVRAKQFHQVFGQCETKIAPPPGTYNLVHKTLGPSLQQGESLCNWSNKQWLVLTGDLNVNGFGAIGDALYPSDPAATQAPAEWWYRFGSLAKNNEGYALYDAWAETTSEIDPGVSFPDTQRLDYMIVTRRTMETAPAALAAGRIPDLCVQHLWNPPQFGGLSDHRPLAADFNLEAAQCNPRLAYEVSEAEMGGLNLVDGKEATILPQKIEHPASMQWWWLKDSGTYGIALDPQAAQHGVRFEIYQADNLSSPLTGSYKLGKDKILVCPPNAQASLAGRCKEVDAEKVVLPSGPYYVRVFSDDRNWFGNYWIAFHKYDCKSKEEACELLANAPLEYSFPPPGQYLNADDAAWFSLSVQEQADTGKPQSLTFYAENTKSGGWNRPDIEVMDANAAKIQSIDSHPISAASEGTADSGRKIVRRESQTKKNDSFYMRVVRPDVNKKLSAWAGWRTDLTLLGGFNVGPDSANLICEDETNPELGHDEINLDVNIDGTGWQNRGYAQFDCNDKEEFRQWNAKIGLIRYLDSVQVRLVELDDGNPDDISAPGTVDPWPTPTDKIIPHIRHKLVFTFGGGEYTFEFNTSKWRR